MFSLQSNRLKLIPLDHAQLSLLAENKATVEQSLGLHQNNFITSGGADFQREFEEALINITIPKVEGNPRHFYWWTTWWLIHVTENKHIGSFGLFGYPPENKGETMIGYFIDQNYEGQGFATEALGCMLEWMWQEPALQTVVADTLVDGYASQKVLQRNGFVQSGSTEEGIRWKRMR